MHLRGSGNERGKVYTKYHPPNGKCVRSKQAAWVLLSLDTASGAAQPASNVTEAGKPRYPSAGLVGTASKSQSN